MAFLSLQYNSRFSVCFTRLSKELPLPTLPSFSLVTSSVPAIALLVVFGKQCVLSDPHIIVIHGSPLFLLSCGFLLLVHDSRWALFSRRPVLVLSHSLLSTVLGFPTLPLPTLALITLHSTVCVCVLMNYVLGQKNTSHTKLSHDLIIIQ